MKQFNDLSIEIKIMIYFIILIIVPFTTMIILQHSLSTGHIEKTLNKNTIQMISQVERNIDFYMQNIENITYILSKDDYILRFIQPTNPISQDDNITNNIRPLLRTIKEAHPEIAGIMILNSLDQYVSNEMYKTSRDPLTEEDWYQQAMANPTNSLLLSRPIGRNISTYVHYSADEVLSIITPIRNNQSSTYTGMVVIDMTLSTIEKVISNVTVGTRGFMYIIDYKGNVIYTPINPITYRIHPKLINDSPRNRLMATIHHKNYQIIYSESKYTQWKTVGVFETADIYAEVRQFRFYTVLIALLTFLLALCFTGFINMHLTKPLKLLKKLMKKAEDGQLDVQFHVTQKDEIGQLGHSFNCMIGEIKNLLHMVEQEHYHKVEAELKVLQAQIKPHFLYNTLDTIRWMSVEHDAKDIEDIVKALTKLFRIGLSKGKEFIPIGQELEHVESYLMIQKVRYEEELHYTIHQNPNTSHLKVLKLILQPIVENAIYHGIKERDEGGSIIIRTVALPSCIQLIVEDDGIGLTPDKLKLLNHMLTDNKGDPAIGYGIFNINQRLKLTFGENYGITIKHREPRGIQVIIQHPIIS